MCRPFRGKLFCLIALARGWFAEAGQWPESSPGLFLKNSSHRSSAPPSSMRVPPPRPQRHALPPAPRLIPQLSHPTDRMPQPARDNRAWELLAAGFLRGSLTAARRLAASRSDASERNGPAPGCRCVPPPRAPTVPPSAPHPGGKWTDLTNVQLRARLFSPLACGALAPCCALRHAAPRCP